MWVPFVGFCPNMARITSLKAVGRRDLSEMKSRWIPAKYKRE
jgi:hypothetical protein